MFENCKNYDKRYIIRIALTATLTVDGERCCSTLLQIAHH